MSSALATLTVATLATVYNNLAAVIDVPDVKKFASKDKAVVRIEKLLVQVNERRTTENLPLVALADDGKLVSVEPPVVQEPAVEAPKPSKVGKKSPGRVAAVGPSDVILLMVAENPKRAVAAERFAKYASGITVADYIEAVGDRKQALRDLAWDTKQKWVQVVGPKSSAAKAARAAKVEAAPAESAPEAESVSPPPAPEATSESVSA